MLKSLPALLALAEPTRKTLLTPLSTRLGSSQPTSGLSSADINTLDFSLLSPLTALMEVTLAPRLFLSVSSSSSPATNNTFCLRSVRAVVHLSKASRTILSSCLLSLVAAWWS